MARWQDECAWEESAEALIDRYSYLTYQQTHNYVETGSRLGLDRRTVKEGIRREGVKQGAKTGARG